ncbi:MAG TPA: HEAT repeat domain-containing protein [Terriglobales bacterium]|jgi:HEAT repeat protein
MKSARKIELKRVVELMQASTTSPAERMSCLEWLGEGIDKISGPKVEAILARMLMDDDNSVVRHEVAFLLGRLYGLNQIEGTRALEVLCLSGLNDQSPLVRHEAAESLGWFHTKEAIDVLRRLENDSIPDVAATASIALEQLQAGPADASGFGFEVGPGQM